MYGLIRQAILDGVYPVGAHLREELLAEAGGVSRTPIREALRRLAAEGLVEFVPHRGAHVAVWTDLDLEEIFDLRARVESYAARRAAIKADLTQIMRLNALAHEMDALAATGSPGSLDQVAVLNNEFHGVIVEAAGSDRLSLMLDALVQLPLVHRTFRRYTPEHLRRSLAHHHELVDALRARDPDWAESVMCSHIRAALAVLIAADRGGLEERHA